MVFGNCLLYALIQRLLHGGRVVLTWTWIRVPLPRWWHVNGPVWSRFAPDHPKKGWKAVLHKVFYKGHVVREVR